MKPRVLLLGGVDPSGGAGLSVDVAVAVACGAQPLPVPVALTVQSRRGFAALHTVPESSWRGAIEAQFADAPVHAVKVGLLGDAGQARALAGVLRQVGTDVPIVVDPVLSATAGGLVASAELEQVYRSELAAVATLLTPNRPEFAVLFGGEPAQALAAGVRALLVKDGHGEGHAVVDELHAQGEVLRLVRPRLAVGRVRGTGCALASAIASHLARGLALAAAVSLAGDQLAAVLAALGPAGDDDLPRLLPLAQWPRAAAAGG